MTDLPKHTVPTSRKYRPMGLVAADIDNGKTALLAGKFFPSHCATLYAHGLRPPANDDVPEADPEALEAIKGSDHAWLATHPGRSKFIRDLLPNEFEVELEPPPPGKRWAVKVTAYLHSVKGHVLLRIRQSVLVPLSPLPIERGTAR
jgi:hypothetical protein